MEFLKAIAFGVIGIALLSAVMLFPLRRRFQRQLRSLSRDELEKRVFRFEKSYFEYLGLDNPSVITFKHLVKTKDLENIKKKWKKFSREFLKLEQKAGHRGRPLIMEYYNWYELEIGALNDRNT